MNVRRIALGLAFAMSATLLVAAAPASAAIDAYLKIEDAKGQQVKGSGQGKWAGWIPVTNAAYSDIASPRDAQSGMASGKRMHKPFSITKEQDMSSPLLMRAVASGEHFSRIEVAYVRGDVVTKRMILTDVTLTADHNSGAGQKSMGSAHATEELEFVFQKIEMTAADGKTMAADDWAKAN